MTDTLRGSRHESLRAALRPLGSLAVAFSGGADSSFLLRVARDVLDGNVLAVIGASETYPAAELESARQLAAELRVPLDVVRTNELALDAFRWNRPDRCYHCKRELLTKVRDAVRKRGIEHVADGTNADDANDYRPGARAARELGVLSPLRDAALTKADIRALSRELGLRTWDKPAAACLASRFPYGTEITPAKLRTIEQAETVLHELGFALCRVRHHGDVARVEVEPAELPRLAAADTACNVVARLKALGFRYVALDLQGYRTGSMNEALPEPEAGR